jgi:crossover junction endodeoxyribonuclease RuvC
MTILGIDPGTRRVGYGVIRREFANVHFVAAGILEIETDTNDIAALSEIKRGMDKLIKKYKPDVLAVERLFFAKNQKTALSVAQARGVILLSACEHNVPVKEYSPNEVKLGVTGYGFTDKKGVLKMVQLILGKPGLKIIDDASDALAIAIMGSNEKF